MNGRINFLDPQTTFQISKLTLEEIQSQAKKVPLGRCPIDCWFNTGSRSAPKPLSHTPLYTQNCFRDRRRDKDREQHRGKGSRELTHPSQPTFPFQRHSLWRKRRLALQTTDYLLFYLSQCLHSSQETNARKKNQVTVVGTKEYVTTRSMCDLYLAIRLCECLWRRVVESRDKECRGGGEVDRSSKFKNLAFR